MGKMLHLEKKHIVITGASSGLGKELAFAVAKAGAVPLLLARSTEKLEAIVQEIKQEIGGDAYFYPVDVTSYADVEKTFKVIFFHHRHVDILVNNAGFAIFDYFLEADFEDAREMFAVNVLGAMACTKAVLPNMLERNAGHIINIASQAGKLATPKSSVYAATKHALLGFTNSLRMELHETNIFVSAVNPGPIKTPFFQRADQSGTYIKNIQKWMLDPVVVANAIISLMKTKKRELNLPWWMNVASVLYQVIPAFVERLGGKKFYQK